MKPWLKLVCVGIMFHAGIMSLYQDALGKEGYIALVNSSWVSGTWTVPLAVMMLAYAICLCVDARREMGE